MGITSLNEDRMTIKVGSFTATPAILESGLTNIITTLEHLGMAVRCCGCDRRLLRLHMEVGSESSVHGHLWIPILIHRNRVCRMRFLQARNRPLRDFFTFIEAPQQRGASTPWSIRPNPQTRDSGLTPIPPNRQGRVRTRATDIDSEGRRAGGPDPDDANGDVTEKDVLPAYEVKVGPPNYSQFLAVDLGTGTNARLQITETVPVGTFPQSRLVETSSGATNLPIQPSPALDVQLPHPPSPSYSPVTATTRPTTPPTNP